jgi:hypothetical protein
MRVETGKFLNQNWKRKMKRFLFTLLITSTLLTACGPAATPQPTLDIAATINSVAGTMAAGTLTAQPTSTPVPTSTFTPEPPTATMPLPTETSNAPAAATATATPALGPVVETATPEPFFGTLDPLGASTYKQGLFRIDNNSGEKEVIVNIYGNTNQGNPKPVYMAYKVTLSFLFDIPYGDYQYTVQVNTKKIYTGSFIIRNKDKTTMRIMKDKVIVVGP